MCLCACAVVVGAAWCYCVQRAKVMPNPNAIHAKHPIQAGFLREAHLLNLLISKCEQGLDFGFALGGPNINCTRRCGFIGLQCDTLDSLGSIELPAQSVGSVRALLNIVHHCIMKLQVAFCLLNCVFPFVCFHFILKLSRG